jgi:DNA-binding transcriptional MerR regulator
MSASALPSKLFFRIGEVASLVGVEPHVLRYWEREFRSIRPTKSAKGQRVYSRKDVENLLRVRDLLYRDGFTIAGAKKRLQRGGLDPTAPVAELASASASAVSAIAADDDGVSDAADVSDAAYAADASDATREELDEATDGEPDEDDALASEPASGPRSHAAPLVREKLTALRADVARFLDELEAGVDGESRSMGAGERA